MSPELITAVQERMNLGYDTEKIIHELETAGYTKDQIDQVLAFVQAGAGASTAIPVAFPPVGELVKSAFQTAVHRIDLAFLLAIPVVFFLVMDHVSEWFVDTLNANLIVVAGITILLAAVWYLLTLIAVFYSLTKADDGSVSLGEAYTYAQENFFGLFLVYVLTMLVVFGGFLLFVIPGLIISLYVYFSQYAYVVEGKRGLDALLYSRRLVYGRFWRVALYLFQVSLFVIVPMIFLGAVAALVVGPEPLMGSGAELMVSVVTELISAFFALFSISVGYRVYLTLTQAGPHPVFVEKNVRPHYTALALLGFLFPLCIAGLIAFLIYTGDWEEFEQAEMEMPFDSELTTDRDEQSFEAKDRAQELRTEADDVVGY